VRKAAWRLKEEMRLGRRPSVEDYVKTLAARPAPVVKSAVELLERNRRLLFGKNPWVSAAVALWLASFKRLGLLKALAEAAGATTASIRNAAKRLRVWGGRAVSAGFALVPAEARGGRERRRGGGEDAGHMRSG
jgi:transcription initiation factor TFIIIB Brf1 subunit/transcription initiation factor TFIIB